MNEEVLRIPQSSSIFGVSPSDYLASLSGYSLRESYLSAEKKKRERKKDIDEISDEVVEERKNFKSLLSAGIVLPLGVSNLYISSNENE